VTVRNAEGARPAIRFLQAYSNDVTVRGLKVQYLNVRGDRQVYDDVDADANFAKRPALEHWDGNDVVFKNGRVGNVTDEKGAIIGEHRFTFDNVVFHDVRLTDPLIHNECVFATGAEGFTLRNSTFTNCATMDLFVTNYAGGPPFGNITIENNVFEHTLTDEPPQWHHYTVGVHDVVGTLQNWVVRHNTFETGVSMGPKTGTGRWVGNLGDWDCIQGITYRYNVGAGCHELDSVISPARSWPGRPAPFGWVDPDKHDFRLKADSWAIDAGDPEPEGDFPRTDRDGKPRPVGWGPDAGAYERQ
jgi:hypothetical protein